MQIQILNQQQKTGMDYQTTKWAVFNLSWPIIKLHDTFKMVAYLTFRKFLAYGNTSLTFIHSPITDIHYESMSHRPIDTELATETTGFLKISWDIFTLILRK